MKNRSVAIFILFGVSLFVGCSFREIPVIESKPTQQPQKQELKKPKEELFVGVMTFREYDPKTNMYKYIVKSPTTGKSVEFSSIHKFMYKDDLVQLKIVDGVVDTKSIALLQREYYKNQKAKKDIVPKEYIDKPKIEQNQIEIRDNIHPQGYPKPIDAEQL